MRSGVDGGSTKPKVFVYIEGDAALRTGFTAFFRNAFPGTLIKPIMGGDGARTADLWNRDRQRAHPGEVYLLLIDSEGPVPADPTKAPDGCPFLRTWKIRIDDSVFFMVQCMESWFLVQPELLAEEYRNGFRESALPSLTSPTRAQGPALGVEAIDGSALKKGLDQATRDTKRGAYSECQGKTTVAPRILERARLDLIAKHSYHAARLQQRLRSLVASS